MEKLRGAWLDPEVRVMTVVAAGGVGKSALVNHWLRDLRDRDYLGAQRVLAWSFYSQGTKREPGCGRRVRQVRARLAG